jgi:hypothetical protein
MQIGAGRFCYYEVMTSYCWICSLKYVMIVLGLVSKVHIHPIDEYAVVDMLALYLQCCLSGLQGGVGSTVLVVMLNQVSDLQQLHGCLLVSTNEANRTPCSLTRNKNLGVAKTKMAAIHDIQQHRFFGQSGTSLNTMTVYLWLVFLVDYSAKTYTV